MMNANIILTFQIFTFIVSIVLIVIGLLQGKKNQNGLGALSGGNQELFATTKERGWTRLFSIITLCLGITLFIFVIIIRILINTIL